MRRFSAGDQADSFVSVEAIVVTLSEDMKVSANRDRLVKRLEGAEIGLNVRPKLVGFQGMCRCICMSLECFVG